MKAILVMDMPEYCAECPCCDECVEMCRSMARPITEVNGACEKPDWCPLVPMPKRDMAGVGGDYDAGAKAGWNACLDAIEGSKG